MPASLKANWLLVRPMLVLALVVFVVTETSVALMWIHNSAATVWIPAGIGFSALILHGVRLWPGILAGSFFACLSPSVDWWPALIMASGNTIESVVGVLLALRLASFRQNLMRARDVIVLFMPVALGASAISATFQVMAQYAKSSAQSGTGLNEWIVYWLGDAIGVVVIVPFILLWRPSLADIRATKLATVLRSSDVVMLLPCLVALITFTLLPSHDFVGQVLILTIFPVAAWCALGANPRAIVIANLLIAVITVVGTASGYGPFAVSGGIYSSMLQQAYIFASALVMLVLSASMSEQGETADKLRHSQTMFSTVFAASPLPIVFSRLEDGCYLEANQACLDLFGFERHQVIGRTTLEIGVWPQIEGRTALIEQLRLKGHADDLELKMRRSNGALIDVMYSAKVIEFAGETCIIATIQDVSLRKLAEQQRRSSEDRFTRIFNASPNAIVIARLADGRYLEVNEAWAQLCGYSRDELIGRSSLDLDIWMYPAQRERMVAQLKQNSRVRDFDFQVRKKDGEVSETILSGEVIELNGEPCVLSIVIDVTERNRIEQQLRASERRFADVVEAAGEYVWEIDLDGHYVYVSGRIEKVLGYSVAELIGRAPSEFMPPEEAERVRGWFDSHEKGAAFQSLEHVSITRDGCHIWQQVSGVPVFNAVGERTGFRGTGLDITERKLAEARIEELATRDELTQLPNRRLLADRLSQGILAAQRSEGMIAVLFIDLDRFKTINDSLGHTIGDELLKMVAGRLASLMRKGDTLARIGGDEFVVLLESLRVAEDAGAVAQKIIQTLSEPYLIAGSELTTSASVGISVFPGDANDGQTLVRNADMAMYFAKEHGRRNVQFYSEEMNARAVEKLKMENTLRYAIENNELVLYYHPKFSLSTGAMTGTEVLVRWHHPEMGLIPPGRFIPVAEETGLIVSLGEWVLRQACGQAMTWAGNGLPKLPIAVNLSVGQFNKRLPRMVRDTLASTGMSAEMLELEITETMLMSNVADNVEMLRSLSDLGVSIAIDDFGTGYSALAYLRRFKIDTLKIDQSFVRDMVTNLDDAEIIRAIIALAQSLNMNVVAEGVETDEQRVMLRDLQCDGCQGFFFCEPLPAAEFERRYLSAPVQASPARIPA